MEILQQFSLQSEWWSGVLNLGWVPMSFVLGLVDGFNPCAMWTLLVLLGFLLSLKERKKQWLIGGVFIASSGIIYLGALLTYLFGFKEITQLIATSAVGYVFTVIGAISIITGFTTLLNYKNKGVDCDVRDAESKKRFSQKLSEILSREKIIFVLMGVTILAFSVNAFELLCSIAIPTIFTATLIEMKLPLWKELLAIGIYDIAYILDDIIVFTIAMKTLSLKVFSPKIIQNMNFVGAILLIFLGVFLLLDSESFVKIFS